VIPLRDSEPTNKFPLITVGIILANVLVFIIEFTEVNLDAFFQTYALVANQISLTNLASLTRFISSQFLHGGVIHLLSNMWFLWIFGDNVEDRLGKIRFLIFYLLGGIIAGLSQFLFLLGTDVPMLGASGAVAGVLGAYLILFPRHKIDTIIPLGYYVTRAKLPAQIVLLFWFISQLFSGTAALATTTAAMGGVAWFAHIGGFVFGILTVKLLRPKPHIILR